MKSNLSDTTATIIGRGILCGAAGVVAMLASQEVEKRIFKRTPSRVAAETADKVLGMKPSDKASQGKFNTVIELSYGSALGVVRSTLGHFGITGLGASALHLAVIGTNVSLIIPALGLAPPVREWDKQKLAIEVIHHTAYVLVTGLVYDRIDG